MSYSQAEQDRHRRLFNYGKLKLYQDLVSWLRIGQIVFKIDKINDTTWEKSYK